MLEHCCGDLIPIQPKEHEVGHWCWAIRPGSQSAFQFIPKVFNEVEVRALCRPVKFFHTDLDKPFLYGHCSMHRGIVMLKQERAFPNCCHKVGSTQLSRMSLYAVALRFPGLARTMLNSPRPLFLLHQTLQLALCIRVCSILLASAKPRFVRRTARWWSVVHHSRECVSTAPESNGGKLLNSPAHPWHCEWWS